ncbi:carbonic anhydrase 15-like isoform X2 [Eumetopias jubatus]|uniref:carbonic anhydrase 15-like isoform X2 n=1 Tax=Eumetopias jubatus TaxID=34886 RepID=UPI001016BEA4|nr:carbonic anhydrase 15-like isoform X2 [Eumetopias jubatus]
MAPGFALAFLTAPLVVCGDTEGTWYYDSQDPKCGPTHWMEMALACGGPAQSPINIDLHLAQRDPTLGPFIFQGYNSAPPSPWTLENDGHTGILVNLAPTFPRASLLQDASGLSCYHRYSGSLTTPSCQPADVWMVLQDRVPVLRASGPTTPSLGSAALPPPSLPPSLPPAAEGSPRLDLSLPLTLRWPSSRLCPRPGSEPRTAQGEFPPQQPLQGRRVLASPSTIISKAALAPAPSLASVHGALLGLGLSLWLWQSP